MEVNVDETEHLLKVCEQHRVQRAMPVSSMEIQSPTPHARSRILAEGRVKKSDLRRWILRPVHLYGFNEDWRIEFDALRQRRAIFIVGLGRNIGSITNYRYRAAAEVHATLSSLIGQTCNIVEPEILELGYLRSLRKSIGATFVVVPVPVFLVRLCYGKKIVEDIVTALRIAGITVWNYAPTSLAVGVTESYRESRRTNHTLPAIRSANT